MHATATICAASNILQARNGCKERGNIRATAPWHYKVEHPTPRRAVQAAAIPPELYTIAAEVGEVDAPVWVLPVAYVCTCWHHFALRPQHNIHPGR